MKFVPCFAVAFIACGGTNVTVDVYVTGDAGGVQNASGSDAQADATPHYMGASVPPDGGIASDATISDAGSDACGPSNCAGCCWADPNKPPGTPAQCLTVGQGPDSCGNHGVACTTCLNQLGRPGGCQAA